MAIGFKQLVGDMLPQFRKALGSDTTAGYVAKATNAPALVRRPEEQAMFDLKSSLITQARANALERGEQFSLEHYRKECEAFASTDRGQAMVASGTWKPAIYADLSGQNLDGIRLSNPKSISPTQAEQKLSPATQADYDSFDRDGDGQINNPAIGQFYDEIRLNGASLRAAFVEPATSFNDEIAKAKNLEKMTFSGMTKDDNFTFGANAHYKDIHLENINGGNITFNGTVDGISISGKSASIDIGDYARVSNMQTSEGFSIIHLDVGTGAILSDADLRNSTVSMTSHFAAGSSLQNVLLSSNLKGLDLSGVALNNVSVDDTPITHPSQLPSGVTYDAKTMAKASPEFILECAAQTALGAGVKNFSWNAGMQHAATPHSPENVVVTPTRIVGGESVSLADIAITRDVATQVARIQPETGMSRALGSTTT